MDTFDHSPHLHRRPTFVEVSCAALSHNLRAAKACSPSTKVMAVVKANAYGHGLLPVARIFEREGVDYMGVAYIEEAMALRKGGITVPILVFGGLLKEQLELYLEHGVDVTASSISKLNQIEEAAARFGRRARVHLKIDTGLERVGVHYYSAQDFLDAALQTRHVDIVGVYSHFADVNPSDLTLARTQLERFLETTRGFLSRCQIPCMRHIAGSGGIVALPESHLDMVRPGLMLYGVSPFRDHPVESTLRPTLSLKSHVIYFKVVRKGAGVGYGHTWVAPEDSRVVTIPIGYGDGYVTQFSNKTSVLIRGKRYPIVGKVCMDQIMVNIGNGDAYNGDEVVLIGTQGGEAIGVRELADLIGGNAREVFVVLNDRVPRVYVEG